MLQYNYIILAENLFIEKMSFDEYILKPYPNEHAARLQEPDKFDSFGRTHGGTIYGSKKVPVTIDIIWGHPKGAPKEAAIPQALRFPINNWTSDQAKKWLKDNEIDYINFEKATEGKSLIIEGFLNKDDMGGRVIDFSDSTGEIKTYINVFNVKDFQNDISLPRSFAKTFRENFKNIFWHINHDDNTMPGMTKELLEDHVGAIAIGKFNLNKQLGRDLYEDYKLFASNGRSLQHSVRVKPVKFETMPNPDNPNDEYDRIRKISEWQMREWSSLTRQGACPGTDIQNLKNESEILTEIKFLKSALNMKYSDERLEKIENELKQLQTLIKEAGSSTSKNKPNEIDYKYLIEQFKNLKTN